jgi:hypothetical protein
VDKLRETLELLDDREGHHDHNEKYNQIAEGTEEHVEPRVKRPRMNSKSGICGEGAVDNTLPGHVEYLHYNNGYEGGTVAFAGTSRHSHVRENFGTGHMADGASANVDSLAQDSEPQILVPPVRKRQYSLINSTHETYNYQDLPMQRVGIQIDQNQVFLSGITLGQMNGNQINHELGHQGYFHGIEVSETASTQVCQPIRDSNPSMLNLQYLFSDPKIKRVGRMCSNDAN